MHVAHLTRIINLDNTNSEEYVYYAMEIILKPFVYYVKFDLYGKIANKRHMRCFLERWQAILNLM